MVAVLLATSIAIPAVAQAQVASQPPGGLLYTPVSPTRVFDSRSTGHKVAAHDTAQVSVPADLVPADATEVVLNLTGTNPDGPTWFRAGLEYSDTSNLNLDAGETRANLVTTDITNHIVYVETGPNAADMIVDIAGYYSPSAGSRFKSLAPQRVLDTRASAPVGPGGTVTVDLSGQVPAGATAAVFNLTGTNVSGNTYMTAYPSGTTRSSASTLNLVPGQTSANMAIVALGRDNLGVYNHVGQLDAIVDVSGYFAPPLAPCQHNCVVNFGRNDFGQQGNGTTLPNGAHLASTVYGLSDVTALTASDYDVYALKSDGTVWAWGEYDGLQLGDGSQCWSLPCYQDRPVEVAGLTSVTALAGSYEAGYALRSDGTVWAWGVANNGEFNDGGRAESRPLPKPIDGLAGITGLGQLGNVIESQGA